jgi:hypothetical protein
MQTYGSHVLKRIKIQAFFSIPVKRFYLKMVALIKIFLIYFKELILKICTLLYNFFQLLLVVQVTKQLLWLYYLIQTVGLINVSDLVLIFASGTQA